ncbi:MAG: DUF481 domain-containing protein [Acidobacteria bacterium]|jgi:hypothetical protein|nr:DUF481 domain-containing protein [Acidobacteriota bacterium]
MKTERRTRAILRAFALLWMIVVAAAGTPLIAADNQNDWQPDPPMPKDFDWIQLTSDEWLKGELIAMYEEELEFDSDELDELTFDWEDIKEIRTAQIVQVAFLNGVIAVGQLLMEGDTVRLMDLEYPRSEVLSITAGAPRERNYWSGKVSGGVNIRTGNSEQKEVNTRATLLRRTPKDRVTVDYLGNFSQNDGKTIADNQRANGSWNRFVSDRFYLTPIYGEYYRDPFQNIDARLTAGAGVGYQIVDTADIEWNVNVGLGYQHTKFSDVVPGDPESADTPALVVSTGYDNEITDWMDYYFDYRFFIVNNESGRYTHHLITGFEFDLFKDLDFDIAWVWDRIRDPRQSADGTFPDQDDFRTIFGVGFSF